MQWVHPQVGAGVAGHRGQSEHHGGGEVRTDPVAGPNCPIPVDSTEQLPYLHHHKQVDPIIILWYTTMENQILNYSFTYTIRVTTIQYIYF